MYIYISMYIYVCIYMYIYIYIYICMYIVITRGSGAHITAASMKKSPLWKSSLSSNSVNAWELVRTIPCSNMTGVFSYWEMETSKWQNCLTVFTFHLNIYTKYKFDSGIAIRESLMHFVAKIFLDINGNFHAPEQKWIFR